MDARPVRGRRRRPSPADFVDVTDDVCKQRLHQRNASGSHEFTVSDEFDEITSYFVAPT